MKTKILFLLCLFVGMSITPIIAQDNANNASQWWSDPAFTQGGVWCDGEMIDLLKGKVRIHTVLRHFKNGSIVLRNIQQLKGELTSETTGEVFKFNGIRKWELAENWSGVIHYTLKGNLGTKYAGKIYVDYSSGSPVFTELHAECH